jgi:hypothetical protein
MLSNTEKINTIGLQFNPYATLHIKSAYAQGTRGNWNCFGDKEMANNIK